MQKPDDPRNRRDITRYIDVSAVMNQLGLSKPMVIYEAELPDDDGTYTASTGGTTYPDLDQHCVYVDLRAILNVAQAVQRHPELLHRTLIREQLPEGVPFTFEHLLQAGVAHELSHLQRQSNQFQYNLEVFLHGYAHNSDEERARKIGRELYQLVKVDTNALIPLATAR